MHAVLAETVAYVRDREQFGRSIGSFQAVKHTVADMYAATEQAGAAVLLQPMRAIGKLHRTIGCRPRRRVG